MREAERKRWIVWWRQQPDRRARLFCVSYAGAGAAPFRPWRDWLPDGTEIAAFRFPGRESRISEPPVGTVEELAYAAAEAVKPLLSVPYVIFGQCSGAIVAFELARQLRRVNCPPPLHLVVAGQAAPRLKTEPTPIENLADPRQTLQELGVTDPAILANRELLDLLRPTLEADLGLVARYSYEADRPLATPITAILGTNDGHLEESRVCEWQAETSSEFSLVSIESDHLFAGHAWRELAAVVAAVLDDA